MKEEEQKRVDQMSTRDLPQSRYDLSTYRGRVLHTLQVTDPRTLLTTSSQLQHARSLVQQYRHHKRDLSDDVWAAKKVLDASVHPQTGALIFLPFRMSCFVLTNLVVTAGKSPFLFPPFLFFFDWLLI